MTVGTLLEMVFSGPGEHALGDRLVATMEAEDETGLELVQIPHTAWPKNSALEPLAQFPGGCGDPCALQRRERELGITAKFFLELGNVGLQRRIAESQHTMASRRLKRERRHPSNISAGQDLCSALRCGLGSGRHRHGPV